MDPEARTIEVSTLGDKRFDLIATYREGDSLDSPTLSGFSLPVNDVF